MKSQENQPKGV